jgi:hypothetical protein
MKSALESTEHRQDRGHTAFFSFLVSDLPDFVSSGGGAGGAGAESDEDDFIARSASRSRMADGASFGVFPSVI